MMLHIQQLEFQVPSSKKVSGGNQGKKELHYTLRTTK
jgi:hypothetical protein